jgi:hypothetical protein
MRFRQGFFGLVLSTVIISAAGKCHAEHAVSRFLDSVDRAVRVYEGWLNGAENSAILAEFDKARSSAEHATFLVEATANEESTLDRLANELLREEYQSYDADEFAEQAGFPDITAGCPAPQTEASEAMLQDDPHRKYSSTGPKNGGQSLGLQSLGRFLDSVNSYFTIVDNQIRTLSIASTQALWGQAEKCIHAFSEPWNLPRADHFFACSGDQLDRKVVTAVFGSSIVPTGLMDFQVSTASQNASVDWSEIKAIAQSYFVVPSLCSTGPSNDVMDAISERLTGSKSIEQLR